MKWLKQLDNEAIPEDYLSWAIAIAKHRKELRAIAIQCKIHKHGYEIQGFAELERLGVTEGKLQFIRKIADVAARMGTKYGKRYYWLNRTIPKLAARKRKA